MMLIRFKSHSLLSLSIVHLTAFVLLMLSSFSHATDWQYSVRPGDTIWSVCATYTDHDNCWLELPSYNNITEPRALSIGERLKVPVDWLKQAPIAANIVYVSGQVLSEIEGQQTPAKSGVNLPIGARVLTQQGSATLQFSDGSLLTLSAQTEVVLDAVSAFKQSRAHSVQVSLPKGEVRVSVPVRKPKTRFQVKTPSAVAAVRGTEFRVNSLHSEESTRSEVLEGTISFEAEKDQTLVDEGFGALAVEGESLEPAVKLLGAPEWNLACTDPGYVEWTASNEAVKYHLVLLEDEVSVDKMISSTLTTKNNYTFTGLEEKCYQVRVNSVDAKGFNGLESQRQLCYELRLDAPVIESLVWRNNQLVADWQAVRFANQYLLQVSKDAAFTDIVATEVLDAVSLKSKLAALPDNVFVRVRAENGAVYSEFSEALTVEHKNRKGWLIGLLAAILAFAVI